MPFARLTPLPFTKFYPVLPGSLTHSVRSPGGSSGEQPLPLTAPQGRDCRSTPRGGTTAAKHTVDKGTTGCRQGGRDVSPITSARPTLHPRFPESKFTAHVLAATAWPRFLARPSMAGKHCLHHTEHTARRLPRTCPPCARLARRVRWASLVLGEPGKGLQPRGGGPGRDGSGVTRRGRIIWKRMASPRHLTRMTCEGSSKAVIPGPRYPAPRRSGRTGSSCRLTMCFLLTP